MKLNYIKHDETFTELLHLINYTKQHNIKDYKYKFSFTYGYELYYRIWPRKWSFFFAENRKNFLQKIRKNYWQNRINSL